MEDNQYLAITCIRKLTNQKITNAHHPRIKINVGNRESFERGGKKAVKILASICDPVFEIH